MIKKTIIILSLISQMIYLPALDRKPWLFFVHLAAVNNLYSFAKSDINEIKMGTNKYVNSLVFLHGVTPSNTRFSKKLILNSGKILKEEVLSTPLDSGSTSTLITGVKWAISQAPHDYIAIDLWNHGSGVLNPITKTKRGVCFDDISQNYMTDKSLRNALGEIVKLRNNKKIDILCFDACLMASIECNVAWLDYAKYIVASEETIPGYGWGYKTVLNSLNKSIQPRDFASNMVESYKGTYTNVEADFTLSAVDASKVKTLAQVVNEVSQLLTDLLDQDKKAKSIIRNSLIKTVSYYEPLYIDLGDFYQNLIQNLNKSKLNTVKANELVEKLNLGINAIKNCVINNSAGPSKSRSMGISIYFPTDYIDPSYYKLYWTEQYPNWLKFLHKYLGY